MVPKEILLNKNPMNVTMWITKILDRNLELELQISLIFQ